VARRHHSRPTCHARPHAGNCALRIEDDSPDLEHRGEQNFSICGIPYLVSGEVTDSHDLAHRSADDIEAAGIRLRPNTLAHAVDPHAHQITVSPVGWPDLVMPHDQLIVATGAEPVVPPIDGLWGSPVLSAAEGVHLLHTMTDAHRVVNSIQERRPSTALIVGAGYIGLEMADALTLRGIQVTIVEALPQVLPTVDPELADLVNTELLAHGVQVLTGTKVMSIQRDGKLLRVAGDPALSQTADIVVVVVGVQQMGFWRSSPEHGSAPAGPSWLTTTCGSVSLMYSPQATACRPTTGC
jgi:NADPH-dependent 2,4-dienoyl-CoA reductase/sulfur reductase-like enzyme